MNKTAFVLGAAFCAAVPSVLDGEVVSFKDAAKIKSWDAWGDKQGAAQRVERRREGAQGEAVRYVEAAQ